MLGETVILEIGHFCNLNAKFWKHKKLGKLTVIERRGVEEC